MANPVEKHNPRWYGIPLRVVTVTFIGTLMAFAVSLLLAIIGMVIASAIRGTHPDMRIAYRLIALPMGLVAGAIVFVLSLAIEIRHYRQMKTLSAIERVS